MVTRVVVPLSSRDCQDASEAHAGVAPRKQNKGMARRAAEVLARLAGWFGDGRWSGTSGVRRPNCLLGLDLPITSARSTCWCVSQRFDTGEGNFLRRTSTQLEL